MTNYLSSLLHCTKNMVESLQESPKKLDFISDYGSLFIKAWHQSNNYSCWLSNIDRYQFPETSKASHPCHGSASQLSTQFAAKMSEFGKSVSQQAKAFSQGSTKEDSTKSIKQQGSVLFASVGTYMKKLGKSLVSDDESETKSQIKDKDEFEVVDLNE